MSSSNASTTRALMSNCNLFGVLFLPAVLFTLSMSQFAFTVKLKDCTAKTMPEPSQMLYFDGYVANRNLGFYYNTDWNAIPNRGLCSVKARDGKPDSNGKSTPPDGEGYKDIKSPPDGAKLRDPPPPTSAGNDPPPTADMFKEQFCMPWESVKFWKAYDTINKKAYEVMSKMSEKQLANLPAPFTREESRNVLKGSNLSAAADSMSDGFNTILIGVILSWVGLPLSLIAVLCLKSRWFWVYEFLLYLAFIAIAANSLAATLLTDFQKMELWTPGLFPTCKVYIVKGPVFPLLVFQLVYFAYYLGYLLSLLTYTCCGGDATIVVGSDPSEASRADKYRPPPLPFLIALIKSAKPYSRADLADFVMYLSDPSVDPNCVDSDGFTPLIWACRLSAKGCKDFFVEQLLMHPYINIEYSCEGRNALQWCVAQSTKDLIIAFTKAHIAVVAGHDDAESYQAAGFSFKEAPELEEAQEAPPPAPIDDVPVEEQAIEGVPEPKVDPTNALDVIAAQRRENLIKSMQAVKNIVKLGMLAKAVPSAAAVVPTLIEDEAIFGEAEQMEKGQSKAFKGDLTEASRHKAAELELSNLKKAQDDALSTLDAKLKAERVKGEGSLNARLAARKAAREAELKGQGLSNDEIASTLAAEEPRMVAESSLELAALEDDNIGQVKARYAGLLDSAAQKKKEEQVKFLRQGASDALNMLEKKQQMERAQAEGDLKQRLAARKAARTAEMKAQGLSDDLIVMTIAREETKISGDAMQVIVEREEAALAQLVASTEAVRQKPKAQTAAQVSQEGQNIRLAAAMNQVKIDAELAAKQAAAKAKLQARLHKESNVEVAIPSTAAHMLLEQHGQTSAVYEKDMQAKQAAAKQRLMERMAKK